MRPTESIYLNCERAAVVCLPLLAQRRSLQWRSVAYDVEESVLIILKRIRACFSDGHRVEARNKSYLLPEHWKTQGQRAKLCEK